MAVERKYGKLDIPGIGEDEPVFVIRAKDKCAVDAIFAYFRAAGEHGALDDFTGDVVGEFVLWRTTNHALVKAPD